MNERMLTTRSWFLYSLVWFALVGVSNAAEFRGLWVDGFGPGFYNSNQVAKLVQDCRTYNFNALIVEMRARGDASYLPHPPNGDVRRTFVGPTPSDFDPDYDALADIIRQCHTGKPRIEVHCWVVAQFIWADAQPPRLKKHVYNLHPEYLTKDSVGQTFIGKGFFLDPGHPDACQWNHDMAIDIVNHYDIDGFHWDYVRYPNQDSGYNETALARYNAEFGLTGQPSPKDPQFSAWRRRQMTDFLRWVNADLLALKPGLVISASVFANYPDAFGYRFQDWAKWNEEGILDLCLPMDFTTNNLHIFNPRAEFALANQGVRRVYVGQGAYLNTQEATVAQINYLKQKGFAGYCLYSYRTPNTGEVNQTAIFSYLQKQCQAEWVPVPVLAWKVSPSKAIIKGTVVLKKSGQALYNAEIELDGHSGRTMKTEPHGKYAFFEVSPGAHLIRAKGLGVGLSTQIIQVRPGEIASVDFAIAK